MPTRVLVVDDEPAILELLTVYLRGRGMDVVVAADGNEALARLADASPDLVLTDLKLLGSDGIDGIEVVGRAVARGVPTVVMTAFRVVDGALEAYAAGARGYLLKPFRLRDVYAALERALAGAARERRRAWAEAAFELVVAAEAAGDAEAADALVEPLHALLAGHAGVAAEAPSTSGAPPASEWKPLGATRWVEAPPSPEVSVVVAAVHAALLRNGR